MHVIDYNNGIGQDIMGFVNREDRNEEVLTQKQGGSQKKVRRLLITCHVKPSQWRCRESASLYHSESCLGMCSCTQQKRRPKQP